MIPEKPNRIGASREPMIARRKQNLKLGLLPRIEPRRRKDGTFFYRYKHHDGTKETVAKDRPGEPGSGVRDANIIAADLRAHRPRTGTVDALIDEYLKSPGFAKLAPRTQADYRDHAREIRRVFGRMAPAAVRPSHIARYRSIERGEAPVRANRELAFFSSAFQFGIEFHDLPSNPCRAVRRNKETPRTVKPERADLEAVLRIGRKKGRGYRVVALLAATVGLTGFRRQDVLRLTDFQCGEDGIRVVELKRKPGEPERTRLVEWSPTLRDIIAEARTIRPVESTFVFTTESGSPYTDVGFKALWGRVKRAHVDEGGLDFTAHDLRSFYVSETRAAGKDPETHKSAATTQRVYDRRRVKRADALDL
jgi:integrase